MANIIYDYISDTFTLTTAAVFLISGLFLVFIDSNAMVQKNLKREAVLVKVTGILYIIGSLILYIYLHLL